MKTPLWTQLPILGPTVREKLNGPETSKDEEESARLSKAWVNFNAFVARLNTAGVMFFAAHPIWLLRSALEEDLTAEPGLHDCHIMTAAQIVEYNGAMMRQTLIAEPKLREDEERMYRGGSLFKGKPGINADRWAFWIKRFREEGAKADADEVKQAAVRAARLLETWNKKRED